ncbi:uncharacterized protein LOC134543244 [Bacillus rossius redtenbacheri]|uniref:uncharacterized protein LOC134543244 n=1 Tax=Bacillus rossius redtenbacheri TaxID=93214 RepID=UPI002FDF04B4
MAMKGEFLSTNTVLGWRYGFSRRELARAAQAQKLCVTHTDVVGALALFDSAVRPHLVLTAPCTERLHHRLLREKYEARDGAIVRRRGARPVPENPPDGKEIPATTNEDIQRAEEYFYDTVLQSRESYLSLHRNNPGFFLETILVDSLDEAVGKLARVVEQVLECSTNEKPIYSIEDDPVYRAMTSARLLEFKKEILSNQSTARKQAESFKSYHSTKLRK